MDEPIEEGISRRSAIKRIGVVGAVAWSAPVLSSMSAPAFAQGGTPGPNPECAGATCTTFRQCAANNPDCVCTTVFGGGGFCVPGSTSCGVTGVCGPAGECPPGNICVIETCCGEPVCVPLDLECESTGAGAGAAHAASGGPGTIGG
jgi:hypothetical protein